MKYAKIPCKNPGCTNLMQYDSKLCKPCIIKSHKVTYKPKDIPKPKEGLPKVKVGNIIYKDIHQAARLLKVSETVIRKRIRNYPDYSFYHNPD